MPIDLSNETRDELIPPDIYKLQVEIVPGGYGENDLLKLSKKGTLAYLDIRHHVVEGEHKDRVIFDAIIVELVPDDFGSPATDNNKRAVSMGRTRARRIVESARAVNVEVATVEQIKEKLKLESWGELDGLVFWADVGIEPAANGYKAKNAVANIITPTDSDWPGSPSQPKGEVRPMQPPKRDNMDDEIRF
jgi:hypothetical protein